MKKFNVTIDVTMSGNFELEAETYEEAILKASEKSFQPADLRTFNFTDSFVVDVEELKEVERELVPMPCNQKGLEEYLKR